MNRLMLLVGLVLLLTGCANTFINEPPQSYERFRLENGVSAYLNSSATTDLTVEDQYYTINGVFINEPIRGFYVNVSEPSIVYNGSVARYYDVQWHTTFSADKAPETVCFTAKNGGYLTEWEMCTYIKRKNELYSSSGVLTVYLEPGDSVQLVARCISSDNVQIKVEAFNTKIRESFDTILIKDSSVFASDSG